MQIVDAQIHLWGTGLPSNLSHWQVTSFTPGEAVTLMDEGGVHAAVELAPGDDGPGGGHPTDGGGEGHGAQEDPIHGLGVGGGVAHVVTDGGEHGGEAWVLFQAKLLRLRLRIVEDVRDGAAHEVFHPRLQLCLLPFE